MTEYYANIDI